MSRLIHPDILPRAFNVGDILQATNRWKTVRLGPEDFYGDPHYQGQIAIAQSLGKYKLSKLPHHHPGNDDKLVPQEEWLDLSEKLKAAGKLFDVGDHFIVTAAIGGGKRPLPNIPIHSYHPIQQPDFWMYLPFQASRCDEHGKLIDDVRIKFQLATKANPTGIPVEAAVSHISHDKFMELNGF